MASDERPTMPPGKAELDHDLVRLKWQEHRACVELTAAIHDCEPARAALERWDAVRLRRLHIEEQIARLEVGHG